MLVLPAGLPEPHPPAHTPLPAPSTPGSHCSGAAATSVLGTAPKRSFAAAELTSELPGGGGGGGGRSQPVFAPLSNRGKWAPLILDPRCRRGQLPVLRAEGLVGGGIKAWPRLCV